MKYAKWLGGGLGWAFFGPIGGLLGFAVGAIVDNTTVYLQRGSTMITTRADFAASFIVLVAAVMKADGKVMKSELDFVKVYFAQVYGEQATRDAMLLLRDLLEQEINVEEVTLQIQQNLDYSSKLQLLHFLYGVANADGTIHASEIIIIEQIARGIGLSAKDMDSVKSMFFEDVSAAYTILELDPEASNDDVKKAFRRMALKYHPDKVAHLGEEVQNAAKVKFQKVSEAYEKVRRERGMC